MKLLRWVLIYAEATVAVLVSNHRRRHPSQKPLNGMPSVFAQMKTANCVQP